MNEVEKKVLTPAQRRQLERLVAQLGRAQLVAKNAQEQADAAQQTANDFLSYCAEEAGVQVGVDGWQFDQGQMSFVQRKEDGNGDN